ncbi:hypothetical protein IWQ62_000811 [Dispira parvispora]|uniref:DUF4286 family protein n=1 Tax=Dispira parvispora TaxID=1520584 RepID=A0A9W8AZE4_9FUNG|nr:hypothetical protein IWQ62_000811 [Dispira parvispora]
MSTAITDPSFSTPGTLVYEVNLSLPTELANDYLEWLKEFTRKQCERIDGFEDSRIFRQTRKPAGLHWLSEEGGSKVYFTVHYVIQSREHLEAYLNNEQPKLAEAEKNKFQYLVTSRRVLEVLQ